ncbi:hypothetical protein [Nisaea sp.]|uniref:hypothetical protein n=1 Tax=Nisaea sp. TaxID=2024842 RepID=UPI00329A7172
MKVATDMVVDTAQDHAVQHPGDGGERLPVAGALGVVQKKQEQRLTGKLRGDAIAAIERVQFVDDPSHQRLDDLRPNLLRLGFLR